MIIILASFIMNISSIGTGQNLFRLVNPINSSILISSRNNVSIANF